MQTSKRFVERAAQLRESYLLAGLAYLGCPERADERPERDSRPETAPQRGISFPVLLVGGYMHGHLKDLRAGGLTQAAKDVFAASGRGDMADSLGDVRPSLSPTSNMLCFLVRFDTDKTARQFGKTPADDVLLSRLQHKLIHETGMRCSARKPKIMAPSRPTGKRLIATAFNSLDVEALEDAVAHAAVTADVFGTLTGREVLAATAQEGADAFARRNLKTDASRRPGVPKAHGASRSNPSPTAPRKSKTSGLGTVRTPKPAKRSRNSDNSKRAKRRHLPKVNAVAHAPPTAPVDAPADLVEAPSAPADAPTTPVDAPYASVGAPTVPAEALPAQVDAPAVPMEAPATAASAAEPSPALETTSLVSPSLAVTQAQANLASHLALLHTQPIAPTTSADTTVVVPTEGPGESLEEAMPLVQSSPGPIPQVANGNPDGPNSDEGGSSSSSSTVPVRSSRLAAAAPGKNSRQPTLDGFCALHGSPCPSLPPAPSPGTSYRDVAASPPAPRARNDTVAPRSRVRTRGSGPARAAH